MRKFRSNTQCVFVGCLVLAATACEEKILPTDDEDSVFLSCAVVSYAPASLEEVSSTKVVVEVDCAGEIGRVATEVAVVVTFPGGAQESNPVAIELAPGRNQVTFTVDTPEFAPGAMVASIGREEGMEPWEWTGSSDIVLRIRKRPDVLTAEWDELIDENLKELQSNPLAVLVNTVLGDFDGDGELDVLLVSREGTNVIVESFFGPARTPGEVKVYDLGLSTADASQESWRFARRKSSIAAATSALYWSAVDNGAKFHGAIINVNSGVGDIASIVSTEAEAFPEVLEILEVELADTPSTNDGDPFEMFVLYRGDSGGKGVFATLATDSSGVKITNPTVVDFLGGVSPADQEAGSVSVGLMRGWKPDGADPRVGYRSSELFAWTFGATGADGETQVQRVTVSGGEAGITLHTAIVTDPDVSESNVQVEATDIDGDGLLDIVATATVGDELAPVIRYWLSSDTGTPGDIGYTFFSSGGMPVRASLWPTSSGPRLFTSVQYPYKLSVAPANPKPPTHVVGALFDSPIGVNTVTVDVGWQHDGNAVVNPLYEAPVSAGSVGETTGIKTDSPLVTAPTASGGVNSHVQAADDEVLVASHPRGLRMNHTSVSGGSFEIYGSASFTLDGNHQIQVSPGNGFAQTEPPLLLTSPDHADSFLVVLRDETSGQLSRWLVWHGTQTTIEGPATIIIPEVLGRFAPMAIDSDTVRVASTGDGEFSQLSWTFDTLAAAAGTQEIVVAVPRVPVAGKPKQVGRRALMRSRGKHRDESATKHSSVSSTNVGSEAATGAEETYAVIGNDNTTGCQMTTVLFPGDPTSVAPVTISDGTVDGCWDLQMPVAAADICGVGGVQIVTARVDDPGAAQWVWVYELLTRSGIGVEVTELGRITTEVGVDPVVSTMDVNGDGMVDLAVSVPGEPMVVFLSDGLGGSLGDTPVTLGNLSDIVRGAPGGAPGMSAGGISCGDGLLCAFGKGTKSSCSSASAKPELL